VSGGLDGIIYSKKKNAFGWLQLEIYHDLRFPLGKKKKSIIACGVVFFTSINTKYTPDLIPINVEELFFVVE